MAEEINGEFLLPAEFLDEGFFVGEGRAVAEKGGIGSCLQADMAMAVESDEEDYMTCLTRQMARSFISGENTALVSNTKILGTSPQSTLCDAGTWSSSCRGSPDGPSQVSSPTANQFEQEKNDAWDLLYAAAGEVVRMKQNEQRTYGRGQLYPPRPSSAHSKSFSPTGHHNTFMLTHQQLQAAHFYQLKQQQLIKQQLSAAWSRQSRAATAVRNNSLAVGMVPPTRQNLQRQQTASSMRSAFLNRPVTRRESAGTGVFLPRRAGNTNEPRKKAGCSPVLLPARVVQALNLNVQELRMHSNYEGYFSLDHELAHGGAQFQQPSTAVVSGNEFRLPKEWAY
ncbi:hypothetical protein HPP92_017546 [Vanilla planifolia]|uniref:Uncharacterized protein n=1 Tax=Vanilla planifolia TaxID=51239 RepID=A0A835UNP6_VANPL|nr:hypothetical protein HPP92_017546 [Vanilla planifolia]